MGQIYFDNIFAFLNYVSLLIQSFILTPCGTCI